MTSSISGAGAPSVSSETDWHEVIVSNTKLTLAIWDAALLPKIHIGGL